MSSQTKLIKDILSTYNSILENRKISEATDVYDNVDFKDNVVGNSKPSKDNINITLLKDIQTAAKKANVKVDITTAVSGHKKGSRHESGNAVDISIINGKAVSASNRGDADKLVDALVSMGYVKNKEKGNPKSVLTFGFKGHDNHIHISNTTNSTSEPNTDSEVGDTESEEDTLPEIDPFMQQIANIGLGSIGIKEGKNNWFRRNKLNENIKRIKGLL